MCKRRNTLIQIWEILEDEAMVLIENTVWISSLENIHLAAKPPSLSLKRLKITVEVNACNRLLLSVGKFVKNNIVDNRHGLPEIGFRTK